MMQDNQKEGAKMNMFQKTIIVVIFCVVLAMWSDFCFKIGWNDAIDAMPKGVLFETNFMVVTDTDRALLPWCDDQSPCYPLLHRAVEWRSNSNKDDYRRGKILTFRDALPKKMSYHPYAR